MAPSSWNTAKYNPAVFTGSQIYVFNGLLVIFCIIQLVVMDYYNQVNMKADYLPRFLLNPYQDSWRNSFNLEKEGFTGILFILSNTMFLI